MPGEAPPDDRKLRVLLVTDFLGWICGTIGFQIALNNPWVDATITTGGALAWAAARVGPLQPNVDLVHYLTEYEPDRSAGALTGDFARVNTIHHVEDWSLAARLVNDCDALHIVSRKWGELLTEAGCPAGRTVLLPNGADTSVFASVSPLERAKIRVRLGLDRDSCVVGFFAKKSSDSMDRKGVDVFVEALRLLRQQLPSVTALIVGPGWDRLAEQIRQLGINVCWRRFVADHRQVARYYNALDFYWITSRIEGGPVTLLEAMASGVCCLATPVGVVTDLVEDGINGRIVQMNDPVGFAKATAELWSNPDLREQICREAVRKIESHATWKRTMASCPSLYETALRNWSARTGRPVPVDVGRAVLRHQDQSPTISRTFRAFPSGHSAIRAGETMGWMAELTYSNESKIARQVGIKAVLTDPLNRYLLAGIGKMAFRKYFPSARVNSIRA